MNTRIKTNKIEYSINRKAVAEKYAFYALETAEKYIKRGAYILDAPELDSNIKSIVFESGRRAMIMMRANSENKMALKRLLDSIDGGSSLYLTDISVNNTTDLPDHMLLQLLLNALSSYDSELLKYSNLTGHFYCFRPEWIKRGKNKGNDIIWKVPCLELKVNRNLYLDMSVRTFTSERLKNKITFKKRKFEEYPKYIFGKNNTVRRRLSDEKETGFILRQVDGSKTEIPFLDFQNESRFVQCKVGVLQATLNTFNAEYDGIANIECGYVEVTDRFDYDSRAARENAKAIRCQLAGIGVHIVDMIDDDYSKRFCDELKDLFLRKYEITPDSGKRINKERLNICVIHNKEYYNGEYDPHGKIFPDAAVQHVTLEDFMGNADHAISNVVHEILIKNDLTHGSISLFDWHSLGLDEDMSFGTVVSDDDGKDRYYFMRIHPNGSFDFEEQEFNLFEINEYTECVNLFEDAKTKGEMVRGLIRDSHGNINAIKDTGIITLPEALEIKSLLSQGDNRLRGKERKEALFSSCLDIKCYKEGNKLFYFVGTKDENLRAGFQRAANVRSIEGNNGGPILLEKLLPTMSVTFVHNGQLTVLPFPFKYLREYLISRGYEL